MTSRYVALPPKAVQRVAFCSNEPTRKPRASARSMISRYEALPPEAARRVASFLLGVEVLHLIHASPTLRRAVDVPDVWHGRTHSTELETYQYQHRPPAGWCAEKADYFQQRSVLLRGMSDERWSSRWPLCGDSVGLPYLLFGGRAQFRLDIGFSVSPVRAGANTCHGGVLVGLQDINCQNSRRPLDQVESIALAFVDSAGALHITMDPVSGSKTPAVAILDFDKWYHLRIEFKRNPRNTPSLEVYLDGRLCFSDRTVRGRHYDTPSHAQIGTGIRRQLGPLPQDESSSDPSVWCPFHGMIAHACMTTLTHDGMLMFANLIRVKHDPHEKRVVTSRPCERYAQVLLR